METFTPKSKTRSVSFAPETHQAAVTKRITTRPTGTPDTPFKTGTSSKMSGYPKLSEAKLAMKDEMDGAIHPFSAAQVKHLLSSVAKKSDIQRYLKFSKHYDQKISDWAKIPLTVKKESTIYPKLLPVFADILKFFHTESTTSTPSTPTRSVSHLPHGTFVEKQDGDQLNAAPDFLITGTGPQFRRQDHAVAWRSCASFIDAKRHSVRAKKMKMDWEMQFCSYARQCFIAQPTRIFVYGLVITEQSFRLYRYDRCGALVSEWISYRGKNADNLVRALLVISSSDCAALGLDTAVHVDSTGYHVFSMLNNKKPVTLTETGVRWHSWSLRGRATICWTVQDNATGKKYLMKQQFVNTTRTLESELLEELKGISGVSQLHFSQQMGEKMSALRGMDPTAIDPTTFHDRLLYRMIVEEYGPTIDHVTDRVLLLKALRDAITVHEQACCVKKILHRDISTNNILYAKDPNKPCGDELYGNLIDFDLGVKVDRMSSSHEADFRTGTRAFQSINVLLSSDETISCKQLHDYLDDIESFFWVLIWITAGQHPPVNGKPRIMQHTPQLYLDFESQPGHSADKKAGILGKCKLNDLWKVISPEWGQEFLGLAEEMGSFLYDRMIEKRNLSLAGQFVDQEESARNASRYYQTIVGFFNTAISKLESAPPQPSAPLEDVPASPAAPRSSKRPFAAVESSGHTSGSDSSSGSDCSSSSESDSDARRPKRVRSMPNTQSQPQRQAALPQRKSKRAKAPGLPRTGSIAGARTKNLPAARSAHATSTTAKTDASPTLTRRRSARLMKD